MVHAWIDGNPAALEQAATAAAAMLAASRLPLLTGLGTDIAGARAAVALARRLGGVVDHMHSEALLRDLDVRRRSGMLATTPNEARLRGDLLLLVGPRLGSGWPDLLQRLLAPAPIAAEHGGPGQRRIIRLCPGREKPFGDAVAAETLGRDPADLPVLLAALRARVGGRPVGKMLGARALEAVVARLQTARFGVAVWSAADIDDLALEMLCGLVDDLNAKTRFTGLSLPAGDNGVGVLQVCGWMTGLPLRTAFSHGAPVHDPWRCDAARLVDSGEADCAVWISAYGQAVPPWRRTVPTIALTAGSTVRDYARITVQVGRPALDHDATEHSTLADTLTHVTATAASALPSVATALAAIAAALPEDESAPC
jgi:formylmethanofuran dehydrogenase subunit B